MDPASGGPHDPLDGDEQAVEVRDLLRQLLPAEWRELVVARAAVGGCLPPLGRHPSLELYALERRVERALLHLQHVLRELLEMLRDPIAVHGRDRERLE